MRIGFIGAGSMAKTFGKHLIEAGHEVLYSNSSGPQSLEALIRELGPNARSGTKQEAADCDIAILATNWVNVPEALNGIDWNGRILIDGTNAHMDVVPDISTAGVTKSIEALDGQNSSRIVERLAVGARVVKSISNMPMAWIQDFSADKPKSVIFVAGDDREAKKVVVELIDGLGFAAVDLGSLDVAAAVVQVGGPLSGVHLHLVQRLR